MVKEPKWEVDPDPSPYLYVSDEQRRIDLAKPYDSKVHCWVPDEKEAFVIGEIQGTKGDLISVKLPSSQVKTIRFLLETKNVIERFNIYFR